MSRYIDADLLKGEIRKAFPSFYMRVEINTLVNLAPSIDIVRCGECRWGKPYSDKQLKCNALGLGGLKFPDDFCSYGEREGE